jgi:hypothetical protein
VRCPESHGSSPNVSCSIIVGLDVMYDFMHIYLIPAPSRIPEDINIGAPATQSSEIMIDPMSSVVVVL